MSNISGEIKSVRVLLSGEKYSIDDYQREYCWEVEQIQDLMNDLCGKFLEEHDSSHRRVDVEKYANYFLGPIIVSGSEGKQIIIDGQQRLTSLTLLLIFLRHAQKALEEKDQVNVDDLIRSVKYSEDSFNINIEDRATCMQSLFDKGEYEETDASESVRTICDRYQDIGANFPEEIQNEKLPYFIDWILENVHLFKILTPSSIDAYNIFETMNDRGLSLTPTDKLKGYLLSKIDENKADGANEIWTNVMKKMIKISKEADSDFFKTWLRSQYAKNIREHKKGAEPKDFDKIGTDFHRWLKDSSRNIGLVSPHQFYDFMYNNLNFYSSKFSSLHEVSGSFTFAQKQNLEHVFYNAQNNFTFQSMLLLSPLNHDDTEEVQKAKIQLVAQYIDIFFTRRIWNAKSANYNTIKHAMFSILLGIRDLTPDEIAKYLHKKLTEDKEINFDTFASQNFKLHQHNRKFIKRILARITSYIEVESGINCRYEEYMSNESNDPYEIEHIWGTKHYDKVKQDFKHEQDFLDYRNKIGGLLLIPKSFNGSYGSLPYETLKIEKDGKEEEIKGKHHYYAIHQNLLVQSLTESAYDRNPRFKKFITESDLAFKHHPEFKKADLDERGELYREIAKRIWNPDNLLEMIK